MTEHVGYGDDSADGAALLAFGVCLSAAFAGIRLSRKSVLIGLGIFLLCGVLQLGAYALGTEKIVWELYPLMTHDPLMLCLMLLYRRHLTVALAAVSTAYLCCQPAKWFGVLTFSVTQNVLAEYCVRICALIAVGVVAIYLFAVRGIFDVLHGVLPGI